MGNSWIGLRRSILSLFNRYERFKVDGDSMSPSYKDGDIILIDTESFKKNTPSIGDDVVAKHPFQKDVLILKRVTKIDKTNYFLEGLNRESSTDSHSFGLIPLDRIIGKVTK